MQGSPSPAPFAYYPGSTNRMITSPSWPNVVSDTVEHTVKHMLFPQEHIIYNNVVADMHDFVPILFPELAAAEKKLELQSFSNKLLKMGRPMVVSAIQHLKMGSSVEGYDAMTIGAPTSRWFNQRAINEVYKNNNLRLMEIVQLAAYNNQSDAKAMFLNPNIYQTYWNADTGTFLVLFFIITIC